MRLEATETGKRIDSFIAENTDITRSAAQRLIESGNVTLFGKPVRKNYKVTAGEVFEIEVPEVKPTELIATDIPLKVVFEDGDVIIINKPRGIVVHPAVGHSDDTLVNALMYHCGSSLSGINGELRPGIVHRIDKDTSGLLIVAKNDMAHLSLAAQIKEHSAHRIYEAIVRGGFSSDRGRVEAAIARDPNNRKRMKAGVQGGRFAATNWEVTARYQGFTHIRCILETGRTHQIRVHMAHIGHPICGDTVYGGKDELKVGGQCLHARELEFTHPRTGERIHLTSELPEYFEQVLTKLKNRVE